MTYSRKTAHGSKLDAPGALVEEGPSVFVGQNDDKGLDLRVVLDVEDTDRATVLAGLDLLASAIAAARAEVAAWPEAKGRICGRCGYLRDREEWSRDAVSKGVYMGSSRDGLVCATCWWAERREALRAEEAAFFRASDASYAEKKTAWARTEGSRKQSALARARNAWSGCHGEKVVEVSPDVFRLASEVSA